jgi:hypothetical protein
MPSAIAAFAMPSRDCAVAVGATERSRHCQARLLIGWGEFFPSIKGASDNAAAADLIASAIDTELPKAPSSVHLLLRDKASWVEP